jgi:putative flippase GtrA
MENPKQESELSFPEKDILNLDSSPNSAEKQKFLGRYLGKKTDNLFIQLFRYTFVGGTAALVDYGSFVVFAIYFSIDYRLAVFFSFSLGTLTNFVLCNAFVFDRKSLSIWLACVRHYVSSVGGLLTNEMVMIFMVEILNFKNLLIARILAMACAFVVNFLLIKFYAFNSRVRIISRRRR